MDEEEGYWMDAATAARELNLENVVINAEPGTSALGVGSLASAAVVATATPPPPQEKATVDTAEPEQEVDYDDYVSIRPIDLFQRQR